LKRLRPPTPLKRIAKPADPPGLVEKADTPARFPLAKIRHNLRTPINHIIGYSEILQEDAAGLMPAEFLADLHKIRTGGLRLLDLINQLVNEQNLGAAPADLHQTSHELRTPVNYIIGYGELLMEQCDDLHQAGFKTDLGKIIAAAKSWLGMMEALITAPGAPPALAPPAHATGLKTNGAAEDFTSAQRHPDPAPGTPGKARLLVVDDDASNRDLLTRRLKKLGYRVSSCAGGRQALKNLQAGNFDLILLDMLMPEMNGDEVLKQMKSHPDYRHIPVIMISALDQVEGIVRCIGLGAEDYLTKPFDPVLLQARLGAALEKKRLRDAEQRYVRQIEMEQKKADQLLLNILPRPIAERLKSGEGVIVDSFLEVTVLFGDLAGFTELSQAIGPERMVRMLNEIFSAFDGLAARHGLEKIKTIGDAYMAVAGLPYPQAHHAVAAVRMGREMLETLKEFNAAHRTKLAMRIGLNSGPAVAGIIGRNKFSYDLWGDTVNMASRMESNGIPGAIQITQATADRLLGHFPLQARRNVPIKGKGALNTWLINI
jgi:class 3 adenylate cyclase/CheY-like chemotaxis protein